MESDLNLHGNEYQTAGMRGRHMLLRKISSPIILFHYFEYSYAVCDGNVTLDIESN